MVTTKKKVTKATKTTKHNNVEYLLLAEYLQQSEFDKEEINNASLKELIEISIEKSNNLEVENTLLYYAYSLGVPFNKFTDYCDEITEKLKSLEDDQTLEEEFMVISARKYVS